MSHTASQIHAAAAELTDVPARPAATHAQWVVDSDFEVVTTADFDEKYRTYVVNGQRVPSPGLGTALRAGRAHFETKALAVAHAVKLLDSSIAASDAQTELLRDRRRELTGQ